MRGAGQPQRVRQRRRPGAHRQRRLRHAHKIWAEQEGFTFPLLADFWPHGAVAQAYGVFNDDRGMANRGTFVIDKAGVVRWAVVGGTGDVRSPEDYRAALADIA